MSNSPAPGETNLRRIVESIRALYQGRSDAVGSVTLTPSAGTTTVTTVSCGLGSKVSLTPTSANAAAEVGNGTMYVSAVSQGSFTITHANSATVGRTFDWSIKG